MPGRKLPGTDVVIIGLGWTGSILAQELTDAGLNVVAIERGPWRDTASDFPDHLCAGRTALSHPPRPVPAPGAADDDLPPQRQSDGAADPHLGLVHAAEWRGRRRRALERGNLALPAQRFPAPLASDAALRRELPAAGHDDPGLGRHLRRSGTAITTSSSICAARRVTAGNFKGEKQAGGNPFEGARSRDYPTPAQKQPFGPVLWAKAAADMGYHPFPQPSGNLSQAYTNPLGVTLGPCTYCGFCEWFGCGNYSKASPQTTLLPVLMRKSNFEARTLCNVTRINLDNTGKRATGVTYVDSAGNEWEQPADLVLLCAFQLFNVHLLLLSGIGTPYDPVDRPGRDRAQLLLSGHLERRCVLRQGLQLQSVHRVRRHRHVHRRIQWRQFRPRQAGIRRRRLHRRRADQWPADPGHRTPKGTPAWGAAWKQAVADNYLSSYETVTHGSSYSYRDCFLDLDPTYTDAYGSKLLRMTFDFHENELKMSQYLTDRLAEITQRMGPRSLEKHPRTGPYDVTKYQTTHTCGGAIMGTDPKTSALNRYLQSWDVPNLFVTGATVFPQNAGYNPTGTSALSPSGRRMRSATSTLKNPGPLVHT